MKHLILLVTLLFPIPAHALGVFDAIVASAKGCPASPTPGAFSINGAESVIVSSPGTADTGTARICTNAGNVTIRVQCNKQAAGDMYVRLYTDGAYTEKTCTGTDTVTLSRAVAAGAPAVRVVAYSDTLGSVSADQFTKP